MDYEYKMGQYDGRIDRYRNPYDPTTEQTKWRLYDAGYEKARSEFAAREAENGFNAFNRLS